MKGDPDTPIREWDGEVGKRVEIAKPGRGIGRLVGLISPIAINRLGLGAPSLLWERFLNVEIKPIVEENAGVRYVAITDEAIPLLLSDSTTWAGGY